MRSILAAVHPGEVELEQTDGVSVISLRGEHDLTTAQAVRDCAEKALAEGGLVVNLTEAEFIDSSIIGAVLDAQRRAGEAGVGFAAVLEGGAAPVRRVLEVTGLDSNMPIHATKREAIEEAGAGSAASQG